MVPYEELRDPAQAKLEPFQPSETGALLGGHLKDRLEQLLVAGVLTEVLAELRQRLGEGLEREADEAAAIPEDRLKLLEDRRGVAGTGADQAHHQTERPSLERCAGPILLVDESFERSLKGGRPKLQIGRGRVNFATQDQGMQDIPEVRQQLELVHVPAAFDELLGGCKMTEEGGVVLMPPVRRPCT
jgi:hypothetical protein